MKGTVKALATAIICGALTLGITFDAEAAVNVDNVASSQIDSVELKVKLPNRQAYQPPPPPPPPDYRRPGDPRRPDKPHRMWPKRNPRYEHPHQPPPPPPPPPPRGDNRRPPR